MQTRLRRSTAVALRGTALPSVVCIAVWMLCAPVSATSIPHPHRQPRQVVHIIQKLELRLQQAELTANTTILASMLSDDYLGIYADGTLATKAETLADFKAGKIRFTSIDNFDRKIRVFGRTAVVTSKARVTGIRDDKNMGGEYRYTRVYHRHDRVWKIVSFEASSIHGHKPAH